MGFLVKACRFRGIEPKSVGSDQVPGGENQWKSIIASQVVEVPGGGNQWRHAVGELKTTGKQIGIVLRMLHHWKIGHLPTSWRFPTPISVKNGLWTCRSSRSMVPVPGITDSNLNSDEKLNHTRYKDPYHIIRWRMRSEACIVHRGTRFYIYGLTLNSAPAMARLDEELDG
ncbi:hypothetical protein MUK42_29654 [Musa troglodytarum]|uniref:Uncharacterized protein n=1 Tax=Musa troglodytarum TaxID=320322 RepID=A0A9E7GF46_9LILI|nr:hypothetical protein MUK42_29654 [Musa troglodytarum]